MRLQIWIFLIPHTTLCQLCKGLIMCLLMIQIHSRILYLLIPVHLIFELKKYAMPLNILITGASKGIGAALATQLTKLEHSVTGTSRSWLQNSAAFPYNMELLDLSNPESIAAFADNMAEKKIGFDMLINNAAIGPDLGTNIPSANTFKETFDTNVCGTVFFTEKMIPLLNLHAKIIHISSKMGSVGLCQGFDSVAYRMSKSALNMYAKILANRLQDKHKVANIHPGWVRTSLSATNTQAPYSADESAQKIIQFILTDFSNGIYWNAVDEVAMPW